MYTKSPHCGPLVQVFITAAGCGTRHQHQRRCEKGSWQERTADVVVVVRVPAAVAARRVLEVVGRIPGDLHAARELLRGAKRGQRCNEASWYSALKMQHASRCLGLGTAFAWLWQLTLTPGGLPMRKFWRPLRAAFDLCLCLRAVHRTCSQPLRLHPPCCATHCASAPQVHPHSGSPSCPSLASAARRRRRHRRLPSR